MKKTYWIIFLLFLIIVLGSIFFLFFHCTSSVSTPVQQPVIQDPISDPLTTIEKGSMYNYVSSVDITDPKTHYIIGADIYTDRVVPYLYDPVSTQRTESKPLLYSKDIADKMSNAQYDKRNDFIAIGDGTQTLDKSQIVMIQDVNFDGRPDVGILSNIELEERNMYYDYYLAQQLLGHNNEPISNYTLEPFFSILSNPTANIDSKTITSTHYRNTEKEWWIHTWEFKNNIYIDMGEEKAP